MHTRNMLLFLMVMGFGISTGEKNCTEIETGNIGKEYVLGFMRKTAADEQILLLSSEFTTTAVITSPGINLNRRIPLNNSTTNVSIPSSIETYGRSVSQNGVFVRSGSNIAVHSIRSARHDYAEAFTALPTNVLSTEYVISSYVPYSSQNSMFLIVGVHNHTTVSIKLNTSGSLTFGGRTYSNGNNISVQLNHLQTAPIRHAYDLSGTVITSNNRIAVFSGGVSQIYRGTSNTDNLVSQLIPVEHWGKEFIIPSLYPRSRYLLRVYAYHTNTTVQLQQFSSVELHKLENGQFLERQFGPLPITIKSNKAISVFQYCFGESAESSNGDPFMTVIPSLEQFSTAYKFPILYQDLDHKYYKNIATITCHHSDVNGFILNGASFQPSNVTRIRTPYGTSDYSVITATLTSGYQTIRHRNSSVKFGVLVYGLSPNFGYGFPAGMSFYNQSCTDVVPAELTCLACEDMLHMKYCDTIEKCQEKEVCFVERYRHDNHYRYRSGCTAQWLCNTSSVFGDCHQCCYSDLCNTEGCGDKGFPAREERGPLCFDCTHLGDPAECDRISVCPNGYLCHIKEERWGANDMQYTMGCQFQSHCRQYLGNPIVGRSLITCVDCCDKDFCNSNCTSASVQSILG